MFTASEIVVTATIWVLTAAGGFFSIRAAVRRKRGKTRVDKVNIDHKL